MSCLSHLFSRISVLFFAIVVAPLLSRDGFAAIITQSSNFSIAGNNSPSVSFAKFDPGLGTLTGISLSFTGTAAGTFTVTDNDPDVDTSVNALSDRLRLIFPSLVSGTFLQSTANNITANIAPSLPVVLAEGATVNFTLTSSPITGVPIADVYAQVGSTAADAYFIGASGNVSANMRQLFSLITDAGIAPTTNFTGVVNDGVATLTYTYAVPEPTTYAMALAGLACGGYSMWRRRKRA